MIRPPALHAGSRVMLVAPAGPVTTARIQRAYQRCRDLGYQPRLAESARLRHGYLAGPDPNRAHDLQRAFEDPDVDAVWALRGGYGTMRILPDLELEVLRERPKAFIGFSDNTALHLGLQKQGVVSFHGPHAGFDRFPQWARDCFTRVLGSASAAGELPATEGGPQPRVLRTGRAQGPLIGGNLSLLAASCGTPFQLDARGCILFMEDVAEPVYRIDRMLAQLRLAGVLEGVAGIAFGRFTRVRHGRADLPLEQVLRETADAAGVPALADLPIGHVAANWTLPLGCRVELDADARTLTILEPAVERP